MPWHGEFMKVFEVCELIENIAPLSLAESWDNVGLLTGSYNADIKGVVIAVDLTDNVINDSIAKNCNMIITHHPALFEPLHSLKDNDYVSNLLMKCIKNNINVYSAHTNMDMSDMGINFEMANRLGIVPQRFLSDGLGVFGYYNGNLDEILLKICKITNEDQPKTYYPKNAEKAIKNIVAFISGSGGRIEEVISRSAELGVTAVISSEFKHNIILELLAKNIAVIQIGHFESEVIFVDIIYNFLKNIINNLNKYVNFN